MKGMTNHKCSHCQICSYCGQSTRPGELCYHPNSPVKGHCKHHLDITHQECRLCTLEQDLILANMEITLLKEKAELSQYYLDRLTPKEDEEGNVMPVAARLRYLIEKKQYE